MSTTYIRSRAALVDKPIVDADAPVKFKLTDKQIKDANIGENNACALVRACEQGMKRVQAAFFFRTVAYLEFGSKIVRYSLPQYVRREIAIFDRGGAMAPGEYELVPHARTHTLAAKRGDNRKRKVQGKRNQPPRKLHVMPHIRGVQDPNIRARVK